MWFLNTIIVFVLLIYEFDVVKRSFPVILWRCSWLTVWGMVWLLSQELVRTRRVSISFIVLEKFLGRDSAFDDFSVCRQLSAALVILTYVAKPRISISIYLKLISFYQLWITLWSSNCFSPPIFLYFVLCLFLAERCLWCCLGIERSFSFMLRMQWNNRNIINTDGIITFLLPKQDLISRYVCWFCFSLWVRFVWNIVVSCVGTSRSLLTFIRCQTSALARMSLDKLLLSLSAQKLRAEHRASTPQLRRK